MTDSMSDLPAEICESGTTLLCSPSMHGGDSGDAICTELLGSQGDDRTVLWVTYTRSPSACVESFPDGAGEPSFSVIAVGETATADPETLGDVSVETVSAPADLTGLGITLSQTLSKTDDVTLCFDSLSALLQYVDRETAYEFLHAVTGQLYAAGATAHFHLDPTAHDRRTVDTLASLFDAIVDLRDGDLSVRSRRLLQ